MTCLQAAVLIPPIHPPSRWGKHFDKSHAAFDHAACQQALPAEFCSIGLVQPIEFPGSLRFTFQIQQLRYAGLHAKGKLVVRNRGFQLAHATQTIEHTLVEFAEETQFVRLQLGCFLSRLDIRNGMLAAPEQGSLVRGGEEAAAKQIEAARRNQAALEHREARQVITLTPQAVVNPTAHTRPALKSRAGMHEVVRSRVLRMVRNHGSDYDHVIDTRGDVGKKLADIRSALAIFLEFVGRGENLVADIEDGRGRLERYRLPALLFETWLWIKRVDLRGSSIHEQKDDRFRFRLVVRRSRRQRISGASFGGGELLRQQISQRESAKTVGTPAEHFSAAHSRSGKIDYMHKPSHD